MVAAFGLSHYARLPTIEISLFVQALVAVMIGWFSGVIAIFPLYIIS